MYNGAGSGATQDFFCKNNSGKEDEMRNHFMDKRFFAIAMLFALIAALAGCDTFKDLLSGEDKESAAVTKAYTDYRAALMAGDLQTLKAYISKQKAHEFESPDAGQMLAIIRSMYPPNASVSGVVVQGDAATLTASAPAEGGTMEGVVHLLKEDGAWKVYDEQWEIKMGFSSSAETPSVPDNKRPYEYEKAVGIWKGHEAGRSGEDWTFSVGRSYDIAVEGPGGQFYRGTAVAEWDLGLEGDSLRVLPGGAIFDVRVAESSVSGHAGKLSLGSFKLMGDRMEICGSEPGLMKRTSDFGSSGGIRCFELSKTGDLPSSPASAPAPFSTQAFPSENASQHLSTDKSIYGSGERITVTYQNLPGNSQDWITVIAASASDNTYGDWTYTHGKTSGQHVFGGLQPGQYEVRLYFDWPKGGYTVQDRLRISVGSAGVQETRQPSASRSSPFSEQDPGVSGQAVVVKDGVTETYPLRTGFFSETRFSDPKRATIHFQAPAPEHSNARRIEITLDATQTGTHHADGALLQETFMGDSSRLRIGESAGSGYVASFRWVADGGQIFWPKPSCSITITSPYTGTASSIFSGEVRDCPVHSAGIDYHISSVIFTMQGAPER